MHIILNEIFDRDGITQSYDVRFRDSVSLDKFIQETAQRYGKLGLSTMLLGTARTAGSPDFLVSQIEQKYQGIEGIARLNKDNEHEAILIGEGDEVLIIKGDDKEEYLGKIKEDLSIVDCDKF